MTDPTESGALDVQPEDVQAADANASDLMHQGMALMADPRPEAASEALACFDRALAVREALPLEHSSSLRFGLAACWLNRAEALMRLSGLPQIEEAVRSCDKGIEVLRTLPLGENPQFPRRLALALHNRALFRQNLGRSLPNPFADLEEALAVLQSEDAAAIEDRTYLLAVVLVNLAQGRTSLAHALATQGASDAAEHASAGVAAAAQVLGLVSEAEPETPVAAELGLKARHALCQAFAQRQSAAQAAGTTMLDDDVHDATDVVDEGLALIRRWEQRGVTAFRGLAVDLFRFGLQLYLRYQPQFLQEFLDENLDPAASSDDYATDPDIVAAAQELVELHGKLYA